MTFDIHAAIWTELFESLHPSPSVDLMKHDFVQILITCFILFFLCEEMWLYWSNQQTAVLPNTQPLWSMCYLWRRGFTAPRLAETLRHVVRVAFELTLKECKYRRCLLVSVEFFLNFLFITQPSGSLPLTFFRQWSFCNVCPMIQLNGWMLILVEWLYFELDGPQGKIFQ